MRKSPIDNRDEEKEEYGLFLFVAKRKKESGMRKERRKKRRVHKMESGMMMMPC